MNSARVPVWLAYIVVACTGLALFRDVLSPDHALFFRDHTTVFRRLFALIGEAYRSGTLPLWDPLLGGGEPLAAYPAAVAFSPLHVVTVLTPSSLDPYDLFVVVEYVVAASGAYVLARVVGLEGPHRLTAAVLYACGGPIISMNSLVPTLHSAVFAPWAMAAALTVWRRASPGTLAALALALGLHVQGADPSFLFCDAIVFLGALPFVPSDQAWSRRALGLALGAALGASVAMIQVLPLLELLRGTTRAAGYMADASWATHPGHLLEMSLPGIGGDFLEVHTLFSTEGGRHYLPSLYLSAIALPCLAIVGSVPRARGLLAALVVCVVASLGDATPLLAAIKAVVPGIASSRFPVKYMYGAALATALALPLALAALEKMDARPVAWIFGAWIAVISLVSLVPATWWLEHVPNARIDAEQVGALFAGACGQAVLVSVLALGLLVAARRSSAWAWALPALLAIDLSIAARPMFPTIDTLPSRSPLADIVKQSGDPRPTIFRYNSPGALLDLRSETLRGYLQLEPMGASPFGIRYLFDHDLNDIRPPAWRAAAEKVRTIEREAERLRLLARLGATHLLVSTRRRDIPGLRYVATANVPASAPVAVFEIDGARPRAELATRVRRVPDVDAALAAMTSSTAPPGEACVTDDVEVDGGGGKVEARGSGIFEVESTKSGLLVVSERYDQGWRVRIDGREGRVIQAEAMLIGVPVPSGRHRVELEYLPGSVRVGAWISAISALIIAALFVLERRLVGAIPPV